MRPRGRRALILLAVFLGTVGVVAGVLSDGPVHRAPAVAGAFYPADPTQLRAEVTRALKQADRAQVPGDLVALIVPHAGYTYSAGVAAYAYRQLEGKHFDTVALIGPSHRVNVRGVALSGAGVWDTPLGEVPVDREACDALAKADLAAQVFDAAHVPEHSLEVQLPFLQTVLKDFKVLPAVMVDYSESNCTALARALAEVARSRSLLLIASSDMSHYPAYDAARRVDGQTLKAVQTLDAKAVAASCRKLLAANTPNLDTCLCGEGPVEAVLQASRLLGADQAKVLRYANSGDVPGTPRDRVVGYGAIAIYRSAKASRAVVEPAGLSPAQQQKLLALARTTIEQYVNGGKAAEAKETDPDLLRPAAAFVTLRKKGALRGCIGSLEPDAPLWRTVQDKAIAAAAYDPRFRPVARGELPELEVEISVLSPLRKVKSAEEIQLGKHGVVVSSEGRRGVFLPQVAEETGWSRDEFLSELCSQKAGLSPDAWKHGADLYVFTVQAFSSPAPGGRAHEQSAR